MQKLSLDYSLLQNTMEKRSYKLSDVKNQIEKVAFDIVRFKDSDTNELWQIQNSDDGDYIVALYKPEDEIVKKEAAWKATLNKVAGNISFSYKGASIVKIAASKLGNLSSDFIEKELPKALSTNKNLLNSLLKELTAEQKSSLIKQFPELG